MTQLKDDIFTIDLDDCIYTTNNSSDTITINTSSWDDSFTTNPSSIYSSSSIGNGNGNVVIEGDLTVGGVDVMQSIKDMQRVLGVVSRDIEKEEKYKGLKRAAEAYERELAKIETFETLKDSA
jgi:hypothetical protein